MSSSASSISHEHKHKEREREGTHIERRGQLGLVRITEELAVDVVELHSNLFWGRGLFGHLEEERFGGAGRDGDLGVRVRAFGKEKRATSHKTKRKGKKKICCFQSGWCRKPTFSPNLKPRFSTNFQS